MVTFRTLLELNYPILQTLRPSSPPHCKLQMQIYCTGAFAKYFGIGEKKKQLCLICQHINTLHYNIHNNALTN
jgi:hypothetical protein